MSQNPSTTTLLLAILYHESGRAPVAAGETLSHAVQSPQARPFVEWPSLPSDARAGRLMTARALLERYDISVVIPDLGTEPVSVDDLARAIHECERGAVEAGLVLVKLDRPWVAFADLPAQAQEGRRRQAQYLLARLWWLLRG